ncbi:hypothetical protein ACX0G7_08660 [Flavitalea antarctica]
MIQTLPLGLNFDLLLKRFVMDQQPDKNSVKGNEAEDLNKVAAEEAREDINNDPDMQPDSSEASDLDEGELARVDNAND